MSTNFIMKSSLRSREALSFISSQPRRTLQSHSMRAPRAFSSQALRRPHVQARLADIERPLPHRQTKQIAPLRAFSASTKMRMATHSETAVPSGFDASRVSIPIDGQNQEYSALLLRDLCSCPKCVHESTAQRLYSTADVPSNIRAKTVDVTGSNPASLKITWENDAPGFDETHVTHLSIDGLRDINRAGALSGPFQDTLESQSLWGAKDYHVPDTEFGDYMSDDAALYACMQQLRTHGLLFITKIPNDEQALVKIATRMGPMKDTFYGYTWDVRTVPSAINAAYTSNDLGFHTDLLYFQSAPHVQLLHCIQSSSSGGASVFSDAFKSAVDLLREDEDAFNTLASVPVNYHYNHPNDNLYHTTKTVFELRPLRIGQTTYPTVRKYLEAWKQQQDAGAALPDITLSDCLEKINWGPPFLAPFSLQEQSAQPAYAYPDSRETLNRKVDRWHAAAKKFSALLHRPEALHERLMKPGECVLFDNTRVLHARRGFEAGDVGRPRWLKGGYVDKDPYLSKLRVLKTKFGGQDAAINA